MCAEIEILMKKKVVVLTGAGMSAESGIATFRDTGGLWEQYPVEDVATPEGFAKDPKLVLEFYNKRRIQCLEAEPNQGHFGLVEMENDYNVVIVTQNVDDLHERAGSSSVLHLHGELMKVRSSKYPELIYDVPENKPEVNLGDFCERGAQLRPHIVWFGEAVPMMDQAIKEVQSADVLVIIGTSLNVYPAAGLLYYVERKVPIFLIDPNEVKASNKDIQYIRKGASEGVKELRKVLRSII